ncbi:hypothetical protein GCM10010260_43100 [Streptomyces filipinensis]|uniref:Uncharacterized protein n=1 Tax=Streptomyces filipinensis TaxID=66887 RepID=A0A918IDV8_9ACTN|nr:hypothetical protein GCM10010260_43100 [Streptomyces filipinensis]
MSLPVSTRTVAFLQVPFAPCCVDVPSAVEALPADEPPEAFTDVQLTSTTLLTVAC